MSDRPKEGEIRKTVARSRWYTTEIVTHHERTPTADGAALKRDYEAGMTGAELHQKYGVSGKGIYTILKALGVIMRKPGPRPGGPKPRSRSGYQREVQRMIDAGRDVLVLT